MCLEPKQNPKHQNCIHFFYVFSSKRVYDPQVFRSKCLATKRVQPQNMFSGADTRLASKHV
jgi:hypothetical protein